MPKNIRIKAQVGVDKEVKINLDQDFDRLEILSLSINQSDVYNRDCSNFGVIAGRVVANGGFGVPNAKIGVFIPLDDGDEKNEVIKSLYPYKKIQTRNEEGYRYNLLPSEPDYEGHQNTGSFPKENEVLLNQDVSYVYDKYYKFTVKTNSAGDFLIYGVPVGNHQILMEVDLSSIGCFSLNPQDFIVGGKAMEDEFNGSSFKTSDSLDELPQIITQTKTIDVFPFWGEESICKAAINRLDFDLRDSGVDIQPTAVLMGSIASDDNKNSLNRNCIPRKDQGSKCSLVSGPGDIEAIRQTIFTKEENGQTIPIFERYDFRGAIDGDGSYVINVPMNVDYVITNEFGEEELSNDPQVGIPTKGKYRFRFKFLQDGSGARLRKRAEYLVPNIKEFQSLPDDAGINATNAEEASYAFSVDLNDYPSVLDVLGCNDYFYTLRYSQVYTTSLFLKHFRNEDTNWWVSTFANGKHRFIGIKNIKPEASEDCSDSTNDVPSNSAYKTSNFNYIVAILLNVIIQLVVLIVFLYAAYLAMGLLLAVTGNMTAGNGLGGVVAAAGVAAITFLINKALLGTKITLPLISYDACEQCTCQRGFFSFEWQDTSSDEQNVSVQGDIDGSCIQLRPFPSLPSSSPSINNPTAGWPNGGGGPSGHGCFTFGLGTNLADTILDLIVTMAIAVAVLELAAWLANVVPWVGGAAANAIVLGSLAANGALIIGINVAIYAFAASCATSVLGPNFLQSNNMLRGTNEWRVRRNVFSCLCTGCFNQTFSDSWINGFLYHFQFKMKAVNQEPEFCKSAIYYHATDGKFYYRSSPYNPPATYPYDTDTYNNIKFSTTLTELGTVTDWIKNACSSPEGAESCHTMPSLGTTSRQNTVGLLSYVANARLRYHMVTNPPISIGILGVNYLFFAGGTGGGTGVLPEKIVDGDIAQALSQNNEYGIAEFINPDELNQSIGSTNPVNPGLAEINNPFYYSLQVSNVANSEGTNNAGNTTIPFKIDDNQVRFCILGGDQGICTGKKYAQITPYYPWRHNGGTQPYGNRDNFWMNGVAGSPYGTNIEVISSQPGPFTDLDLLTPIGNPANPPPGNPTQYTAQGDMRLSTHFQYYFGLRVGASAYNTFSLRYLNNTNDV